MDPEELVTPNVEAPLVLLSKILPVVVVCAPWKIEPVVDPNVEDPNTDDEVDKGEANPLEVPKPDPNVFVVGWPKLATVVEANTEEFGAAASNNGFAGGVDVEPNIDACVVGVLTLEDPKMEPWLTAVIMSKIFINS